MHLLTVKQNSEPLTWGQGHPNAAATKLSQIVQLWGRNKVIFLWELGLEVHRKSLKNAFTADQNLRQIFALDQHFTL